MASISATLAELDDLVMGLVARGMTVRAAEVHVADVRRVEISRELASRGIDSVPPESREWRSKPLDAIGPVLHLDTIVVGRRRLLPSDWFGEPEGLKQPNLR